MTDVVGKIIYLRQHYHFGPHKIAMYLKRYHDIQISPSGVWRILKRLDMSRAWAMSTSDRRPPGSTGRSSDHTGSTPKDSTGCSRVW